MPIERIHTYLVHPDKHSKGPPQINGTHIDLTGSLFRLLNGIYTRAEEECDIAITFTPAPDGSQQNDCRDLVLQYLNDSTLEMGREIARRLGEHTDGRSGLGLLFLISGREGDAQKIVISRFPTDVAIYVDEDPSKFSVEFLERVFLKNRTSYKAVVYRDRSLDGGFWNGMATDRQLNGRVGELSNYWIVDFLASQFTVTSAAGTLRLAKALRNAAKNGEIEIKQEINAAATLAGGLSGKLTSVDDFATQFSLSENAKSAIIDELSVQGAENEQFVFDLSEFQRLISFKTIELSNGGMLTGPASKFNDIFHREKIKVDDDQNQMRFMTEGQIIDERLKPRA